MISRFFLIIGGSMRYKIILKIGIALLFLIVTFCEMYPLVRPIQESYETSGESSMSDFLYQSIVEEWNKDPEYDSKEIPDKTTALVLMTIGVIIETGSRVIKKYIWLWMIVLGAYLGLNKYLKTKFNKNDFHRYQGYFREILSEYSVDVLSYIDQFQFHYPSIIAAMILQLQKKGLVDIVDHKLVRKEKQIKITASEEYLLNHIVDGKMVISKSQFEEQVKQEAADQKLVKKFKLKSFETGLFIMCVIALIAIEAVLELAAMPGVIILVIGMLTLSQIIMMIGACVLIMIPVFVLLFIGTVILSEIVFFIKYKINSDVRSRRGEKINTHLEGLKNFLKDFSALDERTQEQLVLWDEYLIYSVLFEQNKKITAEYEKYISLN